jgi:osmoprotectant transport system substrate-binding protein
VKVKSLVFAVGLVCCLLPASPLHCCVGRILNISVDNSADQIIMGQMLSVLINERTGTTVNVVQRDDLDACHEAVLKGTADIYINYLRTAQAAGGAAVDADDSQKAYTLVRRSYLEKYGMVWLKPFGFKGPVSPGGQWDENGPSLAAPVVSKEVLRQFPVLDRVINKLGGRIDDNQISELTSRVQTQDVKEAVKEFLKAQNLI